MSNPTHILKELTVCIYDIQYSVSKEYRIYLFYFKKTALPSPMDELRQNYNGFVTRKGYVTHYSNTRVRVKSMKLEE
jgi:hypothetical protein